MRATVDAKDFSQALDKVSRAAAKKSFVPAMEGVLVQITNGHCTLTATDLTTWLTAEIPAWGDDLGFVFQRIKDAVLACRHFEGALTLEVTEAGSNKEQWCNLTLSNGPRAAKIKAFLAEDFPAAPESTAEHTFTANAAHLLKRVNRVKYALCKPDSSTRTQACSVQFSGNDIFALDGYRMAWDTEQNMSVPRPFMVLPEPLNFLKLFGDQEVSIQLSERYLRILGNGLAVFTHLAEDCIFNLNNVVPKQHLEAFSVDPQEFLSELAYLKDFIPVTGRPHVHFSGGKLFMQVAGEGYSTEIQISGESKIDFGFELGYMIDALRQFKTEPRVQIKVNGPVAPIILEAEGRSDHAMVLSIRMKTAAA